ncbi:MAG TPA: hypothetical protein VIL79_07330 [Thermoleophilia bacterium]
MSNNGWGETVPADVAARRAGGRRRYHATRHLARELRRQQVVELWQVYGLEHGAQAAIARALGVHRSTVCRDTAAILAAVNVAAGLRDLRCRCIELRCNAGEPLPLPYSVIAARLGISATAARLVCESVAEG